jgi:ATP-dependent DNA helicase Rep
MLREDGARLGLKPNFSILDSDDVLGVLREAGGSTDNAQARGWQWTISLWKNQGLDAEAAAAVAQDEDERLAAVVMQRYQERLSAFQAVDFDDLIGLPLALLNRDAETRAKWQQRLRHVLVDEVQDTNAVQYELLKAIVGETSDLIERMCIEAALELTRDNRASAAEMLGLSRQSLYVKLRKFGLLAKDD